MRNIRLELPRDVAVDAWRQLNAQGLDTWLPPEDEGYVLIQIQSVLDAWRVMWHRRVQRPLWCVQDWWFRRRER